MYRKRGLGDVTTPSTAGGSIFMPPTADFGDVSCGVLSGGFLKKECWCLEFPQMCSTADYQASVALAYPNLVYAPIQAPVLPGSPTGSALTVPPASGAEAQATVDRLIAEAEAASQTQGQTTMDQTAANLATVGAAQPGIPWWVWAGLAGVGVFALVTMSAGSPRRYGR